MRSKRIHVVGVRRSILASIAGLLLVPFILAATPSPPDSPNRPRAPVVEPRVQEALSPGGTARVHIVLRGARSLPSRATAAHERAFLNDVAAAHRSFRAAAPRAGLQILREHSYAFGLVAQVDAAGLAALSRMPQLEYIYLDREVYASLSQGVSLIGADQVKSSGFTGAGLTIAILDSGIDYGHSALGGCFGAGCKVVDGYDYINSDSDPMDDNGHGTSVAGVAASNGQGPLPEGVAPDADLAALKVLGASGSGTFTAVDSALDWVLANRTTYNIKAVNMSLGDGAQYSSSTDPACKNTTTASLINSLVAVDVAVAVASGNEGYDNGVSFPACVGKATAVGGVYDADVGSVSWCGNASCTTILCTDNPTFADKFVCHTNAGPPLDVLAPDYRTTTTARGGGSTNFGGTSAASPYVAGAFVLLFGVAPSASVSTIEANLENTGVPVVNPGNAVAYPRIDVDAAARDFDADLDGEPDASDNCPEHANPGQEDQDDDGHGDVCDNCPTISNPSQADGDNDPSGNACDCDSGDSAIYHGAPEICDGVNNDCSDPNWPSLAPETDDDGDGQAECAGDCDDADPNRFLGNPEVCDGIDNDCNGTVPSVENDADGDTFRVCELDCNDQSDLQHPMHPELCDGIDNDCDTVVPADELDLDSDGSKGCEGDCDDGDPARFPGNPEICDGLDNDCDTVVPADESNADLDGFRVCEGDCDDAQASVYPGALEVCDGRNNDCDHPAWPSMEVESDDDTDGFSECQGDCHDADIRIYPGRVEDCDGLDNDCDGSTDSGFPFFVDDAPLGTVVEPAAAAGNRLGHEILALPDVNSDGIQDFALCAAGWPSGFQNLGAIEIYSGSNRAFIRRLTDPLGTNPAEMGRAMTTPGDVNGDSVPDIAGGAPFQVAAFPAFSQGRVVMFSGATGAVLWTYQDASLPDGANLGIAMASVGDLNGDGIGEVVAGAIVDCTGGPDCSGSATILEGDTGFVIRTITDASDTVAEWFGAAITNVGDMDGDGSDEIAVAAPSKLLNGKSGAGEIRIYAAKDGSFIRALQDPVPDTEDRLGTSLASIADLNGDGVVDLAAGAPGKNTSAGSDAGQVLVFSGATGDLIRRIEDPSGAAGDRFGSVLESIPSLFGDLYDEILVGVPLADTSGGSGAGRVLMFRSSTGELVATFEHPAAAAGDAFGTAVAALPPLDGDGLPEVASGAPADDLSEGTNAGTAILFSPAVIGDCDGDGTGNSADTCTDQDGDGAGSTMFLPPVCPEDCNDTQAAVLPGGDQVCDGFNNDCSDPSYPTPSPDECFAVTDLTLQAAGADILLDWAVPPGGASLYRVYRGEHGDLGGSAGGFCFATSATNSIQLNDPTSPGTLTFYLVAGVRGIVEGSRGQGFFGNERSPGDVCP